MHTCALAAWRMMVQLGCAIGALVATAIGSKDNTVHHDYYKKLDSGYNYHYVYDDNCDFYSCFYGFQKSDTIVMFVVSAIGIGAAAALIARLVSPILSLLRTSYMFVLYVFNQ